MMKREELLGPKIVDLEDKVVEIHKKYDKKGFGLLSSKVVELGDLDTNASNIGRIHKYSSKFEQVANKQYSKGARWRLIR